MSKKANRILVGTDFSTAANAAASRAARLAHAGGDKLELVHVVSPRDLPVYRGPGWEANRRQVLAEARGRLRAIASSTEGKFHIPVTAHLAVGRAHAELAARADATGARLVVVGPHGERALRDVFIGSTAQRLQRLLRVPLLIARSRSARDYGRILVAIDLTASSATAAHAAASLFPDAALHFLYVIPGLPEGRLSLGGASADAMRAYRKHALVEAGRELDDFIGRNDLESRRASSVIKQGYVPGCIKDTAMELGASLVAFGAKGKWRLEANVLGSVSEPFLSGGGPDILLAKAIRTRSSGRSPDRLRQGHTEARISNK